MPCLTTAATLESIVYIALTFRLGVNRPIDRVSGLLVSIVGRKSNEQQLLLIRVAAWFII
jgi:hypothetical protein